MDLTCDDIRPSAPNRTVLDADTGGSLPYARAVQALMSPSLPSRVSLGSSGCWWKLAFERTEAWRAML